MSDKPEPPPKPETPPQKLVLRGVGMRGDGQPTEATLRPVALVPVSTSEVPALVRPVTITPSAPVIRPAPAVFETIRIVDVPRLRISLRRQLAAIQRKTQGEGTLTPERSHLLETLDRLHGELSTQWPDVVVIRRPSHGDIQTNFAVVGQAIYLGEHLSPNWDEGKEGPAFFETLHEALTTYAHARALRFEAVKTSD